MIDYLYTQSYSQREEATSEFPFNSKVFLIAHEYELFGLRTLPAERLRRARANWRTSNTDQFLEAVTLASQTQPWEGELGACLVEYPAKMGEFLLEEPSFMEYFKTNGDFGAHVLKGVLKGRRSERPITGKRRELEVPEIIQKDQKRRKMSSSPPPQGSTDLDETPRR